jgi:hypothetical protein
VTHTHTTGTKLFKEFQSICIVLDINLAGPNLLMFVVLCALNLGAFYSPVAGAGRHVVRTMGDKRSIAVNAAAYAQAAGIQQNLQGFQLPECPATIGAS